MPSSALERWQRERSERLDKLFEAHVRIGGTRPGRRALADEQINAVLVLQLSAEFQGFARELYDDLADAVLRETVGAEPGVRIMLQRYLDETRALDRGNAHPGALGSDFARFGVKLWPRMIERDRRTTARQAHLDRLNTARNAIAHSDEGELAKLRQEGIGITLATTRTWRQALDQLAAGMDATLADHFAESSAADNLGGGESMAKLKLPNIGDTVVIAWAGMVEEAEVEAIYGPPDKPRLRVWVPVRGSSGEVLERHLYNVPFSSVQEIRAA